MGITSRDDRTVGWEFGRLGSDLQNNERPCTVSGLGNMGRVRASTNTFAEP